MGGEVLEHLETSTLDGTDGPLDVVCETPTERMVSGMEAEFQDEVRGKQGICGIIHLEKPNCPLESLPPVLAKARSGGKAGQI
jgi:hypothetical protein